MGIVKIKPSSTSRRHMTVIKNTVANKKREKSLCYGMSKSAGRNNRGVVTAQNRGGGFKQVYRMVDSKMISKKGIEANVVAIEYDPNRTANIALIEYVNGEKSYILAAHGMETKSKIICDDSTPTRIGNRMMLKNIPLSTQIYNVELNPGRGGQVVKSAGSYAILLSIDEKFAQIKMPSGEVRRVLSDCFASVGVVSNIDHSKIVIARAGRMRLAGRRPHVRGKAKNPCDHPHGGGEGNTSIGLVHPKTPWGMPALGHKTRHKKNPTSQLITRRRK